MFIISYSYMSFLSETPDNPVHPPQAPLNMTTWPQPSLFLCCKVRNTWVCPYGPGLRNVGSRTSRPCRTLQEPKAMNCNMKKEPEKGCKRGHDNHDNRGDITRPGKSSTWDAPEPNLGCEYIDISTVYNYKYRDEYISLWHQWWIIRHWLTLYCRSILSSSQTSRSSIWWSDTGQWTSSRS